MSEIFDGRPWEIDRSIHIKVNKRWPRVQNLPDDITIVTDIDNSWYYMKLSQLEHHHRHTTQKFESVFNLEMAFKDAITGVPLRDSEIDEDENEKDEESETQDKQEKARQHKELMEE